MSWGDLAWAVLTTALFATPIAISLVALIDVARRPGWAWALAERRQAAWMAAILLGTLLLMPGLAVCAWYWWRVRPVVAGAEDGRIPAPRRGGRQRRLGGGGP